MSTRQLRNVPLLGALGGPETTRPEYMATLATATEADALSRLRPAAGPSRASVVPDPDPRDGEIHVWPVQGNVYMLVGDGGNIAVQIGDQGVLVVDTGAGRLTDKVVAAIRTLSPKPIQFIVNTSFHPDHTGGNAALRAAGRDPSVIGSFFSMQFADAGRGATIIAHLNVQNRMSAPAGQPAPTPPEGWPSDTFVQGRRRKYHNGEAVEIWHRPHASTDGDSFVQFRRSDVIVTGDLFTTTQYPFIDVKNGGSVRGLIQALNDILDRTVYKAQEEGGHDDHPRARPRDGRMGGGRVPRHDRHRPRSGAGDDHGQRDARAGEGRAPHRGLRHPVRRDVWPLDHRHVRRGRLHQPDAAAARHDGGPLMRSPGRRAGDRRRWSDSPARYRMRRDAPARGQAPATPRAAAPFDLTGYWTAVVTRDWRFRMVVPPKGDYAGVPLNAAARKVADAWDPARDEAAGEQCRSYGAANIMRVPGRLHITWQDDQTLKIDTDAGTQTRVFSFAVIRRRPPAARGRERRRRSGR